MGEKHHFYKEDLEPNKVWLNKEYLIQLNLTGKCPLNCEFCYIGPYKDKNLTLKQIKNLWKNLRKYYKEGDIVYRVNLTGGDIFYHKEWKEICTFLSKEDSVVAVDPLINRFWKPEHNMLLNILNEKINYVQMNSEVVKEEDIVAARMKNKKVVLKFSLYKGNCKKDINKLKNLADKFDNIIVSIDVIIPQKNCCLDEKNYLLNNYNEMKEKIKKLKNIFGKKLWLLSTIMKRELKKEIYYCPVPFAGTYIMPDGKIVPCSRYSHLDTGFTIENFDLFQYVKKFNKLTSNFCLHENKYFNEFWAKSENPNNIEFVNKIKNSL